MIKVPSISYLFLSSIVILILLLLLLLGQPNQTLSPCVSLINHIEAPDCKLLKVPNNIAY
jgi:hypothetical protein